CSMATREEVDLFLREIKEKIDFFDIAFRPRDKNLKALAELDISASQRVAYIKNLKPEDYHSGPNKDTYDPSRPDYYEFGIKVKNEEVYVKLSKGLPDKRVDCMSFHIAEFPMKYPLKIV
ncbi:MAG TPA: hypothetical protein VJ647_01245, partial [Chitinophagaceae bacterium]|nr:hypothetical protein [Chitinophagaceae bacterium]